MRSKKETAYFDLDFVNLTSSSEKQDMVDDEQIIPRVRFGLNCKLATAYESAFGHSICTIASSILQRRGGMQTVLFSAS
jgi:hypothetical protein